MKLFLTIVLLCLASLRLTAQAEAPIAERPDHAQQWGIAEFAFHASAEGDDPFGPSPLTAIFTQGEQRLDINGFYDGDQVFKVRFMPPTEGQWQWSVSSDRPGIGNESGTLTVTAPADHVHGPVRVHDQFHFAYADGTPFAVYGTTVYGLGFQPDELDDQTIASLEGKPFTKLRMLVLPPYDSQTNNAPPVAFPFEGTGKHDWNFDRLNPEYFRRIEHRVAQLGALGIEADLIVFNPYDRDQWGFDRMPDEADDRFASYLATRLSAFHNVWWCMANEFDYMEHKTMDDWDRLFQIVDAADPYNHLRSIHNAAVIYDHKKPWVTHLALQYYNATRFQRASTIFRDIFGKPVVNDEINYEGNHSRRWGRLSGEEMTRRFWNATIDGAYATHGEIIHENSADEEDVVWISRGGTLKGESWKRIAFLKEVVNEIGPAPLEPLDQYYTANCAGRDGITYLYYFGEEAPDEWTFVLPRGKAGVGAKFQVEIIDTWNMTRDKVDGLFETVKPDIYEYYDKDGRTIDLPGRPYLALLIRRTDDEGKLTDTIEERPARPTPPKPKTTVQDQDEL